VTPCWGRCSPGAGIRYLVVRNDLAPARSGTTALRFVYATIANSPGLTQVAQYGPDMTAPYDANRLIDLGLTRPRGAVDIFLNAAWQNEVAVLPADGTVVANGSADELPTLVEAGLAQQTPVIFGTAPASVAAHNPTVSVLTDGIRRREFGFGGISRYSETMTAGAPFTVARAAHDYLPSPAGALSTVSYNGITDVRASSSASDATSARVQERSRLAVGSGRRRSRDVMAQCVPARCGRPMDRGRASGGDRDNRVSRSPSLAHRGHFPPACG